MGRFDRKHSADHKAAVIHAFEGQGLTASQIVHLAAAGELKAPGRRDRLKPFTIAESTVKTYVHHHRRRQRRAQTNGGLEHDHEQPPTEITRAEENSSPEPEHGDLIGRLVKEANDYERALLEGLECECPEPDPSAYQHSHGPVCHHCHRPTTAKRVDAR